MKILLINPPWVKNKGSVWKSIASCTPPFGLLTIASVLQQNKVNVSILDCNADKISLDLVAQFLPVENFDMVGITATTPLINNALEIAKFCRRRYPKTKIILGGVHATIMPEEGLRDGSIDIVVRGEGERTILNLISNRPLSSIKGISYREGASIIHNQPEDLLENLDSLPMPAYDLLPMQKYYSALGSYKRLPSIGLVVSRGCPGKCTFCLGGKMFGNKVKFFSPQRIFDEVNCLSKEYGIKDICFYDDTFTSSREVINDFCDLLISRHLDISWSCFSRVDTVIFDLLQKMKQAGCHQIMYGVESGDEQIIKNINKRINLDKVESIIRMTRRCGITSRVAFMLGNYGETAESIKKTVNFAIHLKPDIAIFNIATPYPGTAFYKWADEHGYLSTHNWDDYDLSKPIVNLPTIGIEQIKKYYKIAYRRFYLRPSYILKRASQIKTLEELKMHLRGLRLLFF